MGGEGAHHEDRADQGEVHELVGRRVLPDRLGALHPFKHHDVDPEVNHPEQPGQSDHPPLAQDEPRGSRVPGPPEGRERPEAQVKNGRPRDPDEEVRGDEPFEGPAPRPPPQDHHKGEQLGGQRGEGHVLPPQVRPVDGLEGVEGRDVVGEKEEEHREGVSRGKAPGEDVGAAQESGGRGEAKLQRNPGGDEPVCVFILP